ncbi:tryptophan synthase subunit alpha [Bifidobacterium sp. ESL0732]|uniref:tryptophan synthase subunit alpha n=1 Tax=Bifidobacterium sp. ESL0732 TaxID=2983222 RepID=UPI0023F6AB2D|nr:tryptophan synthase subunit alpha [Bifidobacterium sp. ESL0732]WEV64238.1 tryptophan synthase subunit alpha [Bifidobacterium sp. ESL0732]
MTDNNVDQKYFDDAYTRAAATEARLFADNDHDAQGPQDSQQQPVAPRTSRIAQAFTAPDGSRRKAFIPFVTIGDPSIALTEKLVPAMIDAGADLIELGVPFSDPTAEGPVIQEASNRALSAGTTTDDAFALVERLRGEHKIETPMVFMTYSNVLYSYGLERFARRAAEVGLDGVILPDVPHEEKPEFDEPLAAEGLDLVSLIAPTSHERIRSIASDAKGFIYCVSSLGVTGVRKEITSDVAGMVREVRAATDVPAAIGFGISTPEQAAKMAADSDGAIVGSAIVRMVGKYGEDAVPYVTDYVRSLAEAVHGLN